MGEETSEAAHVPLDCENNVMLYMGHVHRSAAQSRRIGETMSHVKSMESGEVCVAFLD